MLFEGSLFLIGAAVIAFVSRKAIAAPSSHGFPRFLAWLVMWGMFSLDAPIWFRDPFSWNQIVSWIILIACVFPVALGTLRLKRGGRQDSGARDESHLFAFEKTSALVDDGIYAYIRHPLYASLIGLDWGIFFKFISIGTFAAAAVATGLLVVTSIRDERECVAYFGDAYRDYMKRTKRFIPFVW